MGRQGRIKLLGAVLVVLMAASPIDAAVQDFVFRYLVRHEVRLVANGFTILGTTWSAAGLLAALAVLAARTGDAMLWRGSLAGAVGVAVGGLATQGLKHVACRARPGLTEGWGVGEPAPSADEPGAHVFFHWPCFTSSRYQSFPSGHAATAFAVAAAIAPVAAGPVARRAWIGAAVGVGASRIALNAHFLSDVLAGALIGWWATGTGGRIVDRLGWRLPAAAGRHQTSTGRRG